MRFFVGLHHPSDAKHFGCCLISVNALRPKRQIIGCGDWILDSGAFTEISRFGGYRESPAAYARDIARWSTAGRLLAAVSQDYMCEPMMLAKTGLSIREHQQKTIERFVSLSGELAALGCNVPILPVLQGYAPEDYARHVEMYGGLLSPDAWVGVGSVCKRNGSVQSIVDVLSTIRDVAPRLRLHGFGLKTSAISAPVVRVLLESADSLAWSYQARKQGRDQNDPNEAARWARRFGFDRNGMCRETWRTIGVNEGEDWQTPADLWKFESEAGEEAAA